MTERGSPPGALGAADLAVLWHSLPAARITWPAAALSAPPLPADLSDLLRAAAWRKQCRRGIDAASCVGLRSDAQTPCQDPAECVADALFPVEVGGGARAWRMATMFVRWLPRSEELQLWGLGTLASEKIEWAGRILSERLRANSEGAVWRGRLGDRFPIGIGRWNLDFVTPWIIGQGAGAAPADFDGQLRASLAQRARKVTALCLLHQEGQLAGAADRHLLARLLAHGSWHISNAVLAEGIKVTARQLTTVDDHRNSAGNKQRYAAAGWKGSVRLDVAAGALPWLTILRVCGGGKNPDKGGGSVELTPVVDA